MDSGTRTLLNVGLTVIAPVLILNNCSTEGSELWELGTAWSLAVALSLPIGYGAYRFATARKVDPIILFGLLGTILTGVVSIYANTGEGAAIRPDTPWWYAAKEALIALILGGAMLVSSKGEGSLLRAFIYSDSLFDVKAIEQAVAATGSYTAYERLLGRASLYTAGSLFLSAAANFVLVLYFLLPVLELPAAEQAVEYNYGVGAITLWGYVAIGLPLTATLMWVIVYLRRELGALTGLGKDRVWNV